MAKLFPNMLPQGSKGPAVNFLGFLLSGSHWEDPTKKIVLDGDYAPGGAIATAVKSFQSDSDLEPTGDLDEATRSELSSEFNVDLDLLTAEMFQGETIVPDDNQGTLALQQAK